MLTHHFHHYQQGGCLVPLPNPLTRPLTSLCASPWPIPPIPFRSPFPPGSATRTDIETNMCLSTHNWLNQAISDLDLWLGQPRPLGEAEPLRNRHSVGVASGDRLPRRGMAKRPKLKVASRGHPRNGHGYVAWIAHPIPCRGSYP